MTDQPASKPPEATAIEILGIAIDREGDVPIGVQIAWAIRARIGDGTLRPGQRLPGLRELAEATGVNANTVRAVYQRLEQDGLINTRHGSGTFVASRARGHSATGRIAASAAREASESGIDPRDVAAALYAASGPAAPADAAAERRRVLRMQITALELAIGEIEAEHPSAAPEVEPARATNGPRLLDTQDLEAVRGRLIGRIAALQAAMEAHRSPATGARPEETPEAAPDTELPEAATPKRRPRPTRRVAPAGG